MNAVLFYVTPTFRLTGSTINAIEYFLSAFEYNKYVNLILYKGNALFKRKIINIIEDRYDVCDLYFQDNIIYTDKLPSIKFNTVLVLDYMTIFQTKGILNAKKILVISEKYTDNLDYFYSKNLYNVEYYGEMPFHYKDHDYRMKCLFSRYKDLDNPKKGTYVNSPKFNNYEIIKEQFMNLPQPMFFKSKTQHKENLFNSFSHYLYYHGNKWFDPHPRLFLECAFYLKDIIYWNPNGIKDGSWYRYHDIKENGIYKRKLNASDEIIGRLI